MAEPEAPRETITVPRPEPDYVTIAITDAHGASCWTSCKKADLGELGPQLLPILEEGQQMVHEQRASVTP
jgi:hypothetical protein